MMQFLPAIVWLFGFVWAWRRRATHRWVSLLLLTAFGMLLIWSGVRFTMAVVATRTLAAEEQATWDAALQTMTSIFSAIGWLLVTFAALGGRRVRLTKRRKGSQPVDEVTAAAKSAPSD